MKPTDFETPAVVDQSTLTCPDCGHARLETMPRDACQYFYDCTGCGAVLPTLPGACCVFCSYGDIPCPPIQLSRLGDGSSGAAG